MSSKTIPVPDLKSQLKKINRDLDHLDELLSQIEEQVGLDELEQKISK